MIAVIDGLATSTDNSLTRQLALTVAALDDRERTEEIVVVRVREAPRGVRKNEARQGKGPLWKIFHGVQECAERVRAATCAGRSYARRARDSRYGLVPSHDLLEARGLVHRSRRCSGGRIHSGRDSIATRCQDEGDLGSG